VIVEFRNVTKLYGRHCALRDFSVNVPEGSAFALVGTNGAGKTTAIKCLMNLIPLSHGRLSVLGTDSRLLSTREFSRIGYVSENQALPRSIRVGDYLRYLRPFYSTWDIELEQRLIRQLRLPEDRKIGELSHGTRVKMALACALSFRPVLLVLDEPFSGLDPLMRDELTDTLMAQLEETTVLLSSHELSEIETFITHVAFLDAGRLLFQDPIADLSDRLREVRVTLTAAPVGALQVPPEWLHVRVVGNVLSFVDTNFSDGSFGDRLSSVISGVREVDAQPMGLRHIFTTLARAAQRQESAL